MYKSLVSTMPNSSKDNLFVLVKSLSQSEKRHFKLYVNRLDVNSDAKFMQLFNILDKLKCYDENQILKVGFVTKMQIANLKSHLYKQILVSLRMNPVNQNTRINIREQLDFATILYHKGLYRQSLIILEKTKTIALENEEKNIAYEIVELEKVIESQFITRSIKSRADDLAIQSKELSAQNLIASKLSNLSLQLYSYMLKSGYAKNDEEKRRIKSYFDKSMPKFKFENLGFREKLWLYKANLWHSFLIQDFLSCYRYAKKWMDLFYENEPMIYANPVWFIKGNSYFLECLYLIKHQSMFENYLLKMEKSLEHISFPKNDNVLALDFLCCYSHKINGFFLNGNFAGGLYLVDDILEKITLHQNRIDENHVMVLYYKIACLYFGAADNLNCIVFLSKIITNKNLFVREDLMCFARILNLIAHYEAGKDEDLSAQVKETYNYLTKMNELHEVQKEIILFLKNIETVYPLQLKHAFKSLHKKLKPFENQRFENRVFLYLDIISWLESKIENRPIAEIIQEKFKKLVR